MNTNPYINRNYILYKDKTLSYTYMITILATCAGGHGKQNLFDSLYNNPDNEDVKLVTCDIKNHELLKHQTDKFYTIPKSNDINFIPKLLEICKIENIDVIISSNEDECHIIAKNIELFHKIGTYPLAVLAKENGVPFYVTAPTSTLDLSLRTGDEIPIEERDATEILEFAGHRTAPIGANAVNFAFDVTPNRYVNGIVTEYGVLRRPYRQTIASLMESKSDKA